MNSSVFPSNRFPHYSLLSTHYPLLFTLYSLLSTLYSFPRGHVPLTSAASRYALLRVLPSFSHLKDGKKGGKREQVCDENGWLSPRNALKFSKILIHSHVGHYPNSFHSLILEIYIFARKRLMTSERRLYFYIAIFY